MQVLGHVCKPTGLPFSADSERVVIEVNKSNNYSASDSKFMPMRSQSISKEEQILVRDPSTEQEECETPRADAAMELRHDAAENESEELLPKDDDDFLQLPLLDLIKSPHKEVLAFFPGFNSCLKKSLHTLGQVVAVTKIAEHVIQVIFTWINGQGPTHRHASAMSSSDRNKERIMQLMRERPLRQVLAKFI